MLLELPDESEGSYRVGRNFNPSDNQDVDTIKFTTSQLIDLVLRNGKEERTAAIAATKFEDAAMWAVKSLTKPSRAQSNAATYT